MILYTASPEMRWCCNLQEGEVCWKISYGQLQDSALPPNTGHEESSRCLMTKMSGYSAVWPLAVSWPTQIFLQLTCFMYFLTCTCTKISWCESWPNWAFLHPNLSGFFCLTSLINADILNLFVDLDTLVFCRPTSWGVSCSCEGRPASPPQWTAARARCRPVWG